jgi:hypothetical protein
MKEKSPIIAKSRNTSISKTTVPKTKINQPLSMKFMIDITKYEKTEAIAQQITALKTEKAQLIKLLKGSEVLMDEKKKKYATERESVKKVFEEILPIIDSHITNTQKSQIIEFLQSIQRSTVSGNQSEEVQCCINKFDEDNASTLCTNRDWMQSEITKFKAQADGFSEKIKHKREILSLQTQKIANIQRELQPYRRFYRNDGIQHKTAIPSFFFSLA